MGDDESMRRAAEASALREYDEARVKAAELRDELQEAELAARDALERYKEVYRRNRLEASKGGMQ